MNAREKADARLRAAVDAVTGSRSPTKRVEAAVALRREAERELARIRHEARSWALRAMKDWYAELAKAVASGNSAAVSTVLDDAASDVADVSDQRFAQFRATTSDVDVIRKAVRRRVSASWVLAYLVLRTGAFDQPRVQSPTAKQVAAMKEALRKTSAA